MYTDMEIMFSVMAIAFVIVGLVVYIALGEKIAEKLLNKFQ